MGTTTNGAAVAERGKNHSPRKTPESLAIARKGVKTANDFACLMGALMSDMIEGSVSAEVGNATCKAGSNLLKVVEMQYRYGTPGRVTDRKNLELSH
jgi:hypothetical protein